MYEWKNKKSGAKGTCTKDQMEAMKNDPAFRDDQGRCKLKFNPAPTTKTATKPTATPPVTK